MYKSINIFVQCYRYLFLQLYTGLSYFGLDFLLINKTQLNQITKIKADKAKEKAEKNKYDTYINNIQTKLKKSLQRDDKNINIDPSFYLKETWDSKEKLINLSVIWSSRILFEKTPTTNVAMYYDAYKQSFSYWCDTTVPYEILRVCAMKYVYTFKCCDFLIDDIMTECNQSLPFIQMERAKEEDLKSGKKVFDPSVLGIHHSSFMKPKVYAKPVHIVATPKLTNRFTRIGKLSSVNFLVRPPPPEQKKISYSDFKKRKMEIAGLDPVNKTNNNDDDDFPELIIEMSNEYNHWY